VVLRVFILTRQPPHFIPEVNRKGAVVKRQPSLGLQDQLPLLIVNRAKDSRAFLISFQRKLPYRPGHEPGAYFSPYEVVRVLTLTNLPGIIHNAATCRRFDYPAVDSLDAAVIN